MIKMFFIDLYFKLSSATNEENVIPRGMPQISWSLNILY